jgi:hypothetical protein
MSDDSNDEDNKAMTESRMRNEQGEKPGRPLGCFAPVTFYIIRLTFDPFLPDASCVPCGIGSVMLVSSRPAAATHRAVLFRKSDEYRNNKNDVCKSAVSRF